MLNDVWNWIVEHRVMLYWCSGGAVVTMVIGAIAAAIVVVQIPADYFEKAKGGHKRPWTAKRIAKNVAGAVLVAAGLTMLVMPGPGFMVLLIGVALTDFPGKVRLERWIVTRGNVLKKANRLRAKYGKEPLRVNGAPNAGAAR